MVQLGFLFRTAVDERRSRSPWSVAGAPVVCQERTSARRSRRTWCESRPSVNSGAVSHLFLQFRRSREDKQRTREIAVALLNTYSNRTYSRGQWVKHPPFHVEWNLHRGNQLPERQQSVMLTLQLVERVLAETRTWKFEQLKLQDPHTVWLDLSIPVSINFQQITIRFESPIGGAFPYHPAIDREGTLYTSFQAVLLKRLATLRRELVTTSDKFADEAWVLTLRNLVTEAVALIGGMLHQLYYKAEYNPDPGWTFNRARLGDRSGRRLADKLNWVHAITGKHINAPAEITALEELKRLRNHLQHFDPPTFAFSLEDVTGWLNLIPAVGRLSWAIRKCIGATLSVPLIELLLSDDVLFVPLPGRPPRTPQAPNTGYASTKER